MTSKSVSLMDEGPCYDFVFQVGVFEHLPVLTCSNREIARMHTINY
jgi:hypothetical protein